MTIFQLRQAIESRVTVWEIVLLYIVFAVPTALIICRAARDGK